MDKKYQNISVRRELKQRLKILAAQKHLSLNLLIQTLLEKYQEYGK